jgi:ribose/xylose/arabinose/galactoside ABC-type transport system permease subunit
VKKLKQPTSVGRHAEKQLTMKKEYKILLIGLVAVGLLDTFGSVASRLLDFNYSFLSPVSFLIYGTTAFLVTRNRDLKVGVLFGAILGFFDSTIGLKISILLDANTGDSAIELTTVLWVVTAILMTGLGALVGLIGGVLARIVKKKSRNAQQKLP